MAFPSGSPLDYDAVFEENTIGVIAPPNALANLGERFHGGRVP